jgi:dipeptidyl aminopeptidase/acylaminoacyl peptidase
MRPPNFDSAKSYPMILQIHGGPWAAYGPQFAANNQLYAAAGYVVIYGNPRGSTGYGAEFAHTIDFNFPSRDYDDLMDMVDSTIAMGFVDKDRLYVTGGSGGGTLTTWIVGKTDRFRAAVAVNPVINWTTSALTSDVDKLIASYWFTDLPWENSNDYWSYSPLSLVGNVTTPTMLMTGEEDWRTPIWEAEQYFNALQIEDVDTALVRVPGASHWIEYRPSQLIAKVNAILAWFERYSQPTDASIEK